MIFSEYKSGSSFEDAVVINNIDDSNPYTEIAAKTFLSKKSIREVTLPESIVKIGDWAFAHMKSLKRITIPANNIVLGKEVFLDCPELKEINIYPDMSENEGLGLLFATAFLVLKRNDLFTPKRASSKEEHINWIHDFDIALIEYIGENDSKNFEPVLYGWFNDEGEDTQILKYVNNVREVKSRLCFWRLRYNLYLDHDTEKYLMTYIKSHMPYGEKESEHTAAFDIIINECCNDIEYFKILYSSDGINTNTSNLLLDALQKKGASPEISAFIMSKIKQDNSTEAFAEFDL